MNAEHGVHYDVVVIGTGQSGPSLAARFAAAGLHVAIVERDKFGGTCVNNGCIPTKTLVASAYAAHLARRAGEYGVDTGPVSVDMKRVKARKDQISGAASQGVERWMRDNPQHHGLSGARSLRRVRMQSQVGERSPRRRPRIHQRRRPPAGARDARAGPRALT